MIQNLPDENQIFSLKSAVTAFSGWSVLELFWIAFPPPPGQALMGGIPPEECLQTTKPVLLWQAKKNAKPLNL
ncbi:MAG: hypothetical protein KC553_09085 [Nitrospina sp.]|nr:hypothetical protein [Nitrospina sp.]